MAKQSILWTALPFGRVADGPHAGSLRLSIVVSPRLTPQSAAEQKLGAPGFADFHNWPETLDRIKLGLRIGNQTVPVQRVSKTDAQLWKQVFGAATPVEGFTFRDMSQVNLRSFPVRNVLGFVREHHGRIAQANPVTPPTLLPWRGADPALKDMLTGLGTRVEKINLGGTSLEVMHPGFDRFFSDDKEKAIEATVDRLVFSEKGRYRIPVAGIDGQVNGKQVAAIRALPSDWQDPALGGPDAALMSQFASAAEYTFYQANRFYRRQPATKAEQAIRRPSFNNVPAAPKAPEFDFHRLIASLSDMPQLLRKLGLIIDVVLPADNPVAQALKNQPQAEGVVGVEVLSWAGHDLAADRYPRTAWRATARRFVTRARTSDQQDGLLALAGTVDPTLAPKVKQRSDFDLFQVDPDGAALKTVDFLLSAQNLVGRSIKPGTHGAVTYTTGDKQPVAALRSGGLGVSRHGRAAQVAMLAAATKLKNDAAQVSADESRKVVLFAEDVTRGYRIDVHTRDRWHSLCAREGEYTLQATGEKLALPPDEGYIKGASTTGDGQDDHYLHETLFRWTGWSLVAPRPGRTILAVDQPGSGLQSETVTEIEDQADDGHGVLARFKAQKGSLPRLRFGWTYRFRARMADLAGNSLDLDDPSLKDDPQVTEPVPYLRFEPIDPPVLVHAHRVSEGESLERMVLRSNHDSTPTAYLQSPDFKASTHLPPSADFAYVATCDRHVVPPKSSQLQCEQHGLFDEAMGSGDPVRVKSAYALAGREAGTLYDQTDGSDIELVTPTSVAASAKTASVPPKLPDAQHPTGERLVGGQYIVHHEQLVQTPYLPDGAAAGVAITALTRGDMRRIGVIEPAVLAEDAAIVLGPQEELVLVVRHGKRWPDTTGLRIIMAERKPTPQVSDSTCLEEPVTAADRPVWDADKRTLTLFVRKGHIARLRYASLLDREFLSHMGLPMWSNGGAEFQKIARRALLGLHWMVTPQRELTLVHATQQPVCTPRLQSVVVQRQAGDTFADLQARVQLHGPSTGKFEVEAEWDEWVDDLNQPGPVRRRMSGQLGEIPLPDNHENHFSLATVAAAAKPPAGNAGGGKGERALGNRHEFGDQRFRLVRYRLKGTTRFREYLPPALYAQTPLVTRTGPQALETQAHVGASDDAGAPVLFNVAGSQPDGVVVPHSGIPDTPAVMCVLPTMSWQRQLGASRTEQLSTRLGNSLRVYIDRPWFQTGNGELLGVVLHLNDNGAFNKLADAQVPFVSQWGLDPLHDSDHPKAHAKATDFPARVSTENVALLENGQQVTVVGHRVQWDAQRKLWFADIEIAAGASYMPFVRLSVVRYQPHSLPGHKVSRTVLTEFTQVLPRRKAVLKRVGRRDYAITLHGPVPEHGPMRLINDSAHVGISLIPKPGTEIESGRNRVELVLQTRDPQIDSDLAWSDVQVLASGLALPPGATVDRVPGGVFSGAAGTATAQPQPTAVPMHTKPVTVLDRLGEIQRFDREINVTLPPVFELFDPAIWQGRATFSATDPLPYRLVLREFERYYTDRTVPERHGDKVLARRVVEERLVYTEFFPV